MGHMNVIPVISKGFNFYFPMLICLLSIGTFFRLGSRCLHACGIRQFFDDDDLSAEYIEDGKALMRQGKDNERFQSQESSLLCVKNVEIMEEQIHWRIRLRQLNVEIDEEN